MLNRKIKITLAIVGAIIVVVIVLQIYSLLKPKYTLSQLPDYYQKLIEQCRQKESYNCCMASVNEMANKNYQLESSANGCPSGYARNMLKCADTFVWCEPIK